MCVCVSLSLSPESLPVDSPHRAPLGVFLALTLPLSRSLSVCVSLSLSLFSLSLCVCPESLPVDSPHRAPLGVFLALILRSQSYTQLHAACVDLISVNMRWSTYRERERETHRESQSGTQLHA